MPTPAAAERPRLASCLASYLRQLEALRFAPSSIGQSRYVLGELVEFLERRGVTSPAAVSEAHLVRYCRWLSWRTRVRGQRLAPASRYIYLARVRRFFRQFHRDGRILHDPARNLVLPSHQALPREVLTLSEARRLVNAPERFSPLGQRDQALLETLYGTGLRLRELAMLELKDLSLGARTLFVKNGKGRRDRVVPVVGRGLAALVRYLQQSRPQLMRNWREGALFLSAGNRAGRRLSAIAIEQLVRKYAQQAKIARRVSPHVLRHSCATHLLRGGADIRHVQMLLGHRRLTSTALYTRVEISDLHHLLSRSHPRERASPARVPRKR